jgi:hypothetical protein
MAGTAEMHFGRLSRSSGARPALQKEPLTSRSGPARQFHGPVRVPERNLERIARRKCTFQLTVQFQVEALLCQPLLVAPLTDVS